MYRIFFDLETTGINPALDEVVSCAYIADKNGESFLRNYFYVRPEKFSADAQKIHGIKEEQLISARSQAQFAETMLSLFEKFPGEIICHSRSSNLTFDLGFVFAASFYNGLRERFYRAREKITEISTIDMAKNKLAVKDYSLKTIANYFNINLKHHDARSDVEACRLIYYKLIEGKHDFGEIKKNTSSENDFRTTLL